MAGIAPERGSVGDWYVCFAALSSNDTDIASWSARTLRGLFLDDNDNNHQNFEVLCNSVSRYQRHFGRACLNLSSPILTLLTRSIGLSLLQEHLEKVAVGKRGSWFEGSLHLHMQNPS
jgi:hypothetical protein